MKAIFLDRDGVINKPIYDENRKIYRPPWNKSELKLMPYVIDSLKRLTEVGYALFIITNQPDFVKGLVEIDSLKEIRQCIFNFLIKHDINLKNDYYCFHHPDHCTCECRKPSPYFLLQASKIYNIDLSKSWMIGDRNSDIICGQNAGVKTIMVDNIMKEKITCNPSYTCKGIKEATNIILQEK